MTEGLALEREGDALLTSGLWNRRRDLRAVRRHLGTEFGFDPADVGRCGARGSTRFSRRGTGACFSGTTARTSSSTPKPCGGRICVASTPATRVSTTSGASPSAAAAATMPCPLPKTRSRSARADDDVAKLYHQIKPVTGQRNPPRDTAWAVANNRPEAEGYAAYVPGRVYVGAFDARVRGRGCRRGGGAAAVGDDGAARAITRNAGRVAWWRPSEGRGGIVPEGVTGLRNAADGVWDPDKAREKGEIAVFREDLGFGAAALVPGEGVWFEESLDAVDRAASTTVDSTADTAHKSATPSDGPPSAPVAPAPRRARDGPRGEPPRRACPATPRRRRRRPPRLAWPRGRRRRRRRGDPPAARAAERAAMVPLGAREARAPRDGVRDAPRSGSCATTARASSPNAERERDGSRQTKRLSMVERPKRLSPPGSRRPAAARSRVPRDVRRGAEPGGPSCGETVAGNGGRAEGGSAAGLRLRRRGAHRGGPAGFAAEGGGRRGPPCSRCSRCSRSRRRTTRRERRR